MSARQEKSQNSVRGNVLCFGGGQYCLNKKSPKAPKWLSVVMLSDIIGLTCRNALAFDNHTRKELKKDSKTLAKALLALGMKPGDYLVILDNFYPCICAVYAAMRINAIAVPFAEDATDEILAQFIMDREGDTFLIANNKTVKYAEKICQKTAYKCKCVISVNDKSRKSESLDLKQKYYDYCDIPTVARMGHKRLHIPWSNGEAVMLGSSSGTSGEVKFFPYTDRNIISSVLASQVAFNVSLFKNNKETWAGVVPRQRPYGLLNSALIPSWGRRRVYLARPDDTVNELFTKAQVICCATDFVEIVENELTISGYDLTPDGNEKPITIVIGGAYLTAAKSEAFLTFLHERGFDAKICPGYGISEAAGCISVVPANDYRPGTVGRLTPGVKIWLKKDDGSAYKLGEQGRLWVSGDSVIHNYYNNKNNEKGVCVDDNGEIWVDTGDYMSLQQSGCLIFHYSEKDFYFAKTHEKIYPRKAEDVIIRMNGVERCWVLGDSKRAVSIAFIAPKEDIDEEILKQSIIENITQAKTEDGESLSELEIPRYYQIVQTSDLQEDKSGKRLKTVKDRLLKMINFEKPDL